MKKETSFASIDDKLRGTAYTIATYIKDNSIGKNRNNTLN